VRVSPANLTVFDTATFLDATRFSAAFAISSSASLLSSGFLATEADDESNESSIIASPF
jgi:hypothetical protein